MPWKIRVKAKSLDKTIFFLQISPTKLRITMTNLLIFMAEKHLLRIIALAALSTIIKSPAGAQEPALSLQEVLHKADSVSHYQDSIFNKTRYSVREEMVFSEVDKAGNLKSSDTLIADLIMRGHEEVSRSPVYSTKEPGGEKKESHEGTFSLSFADSNYNYSLTDFDESSYKIGIVPKAMPPRKGDVGGVAVIDRDLFYTREINIEVPRPRGALKEIRTELSFEPLEGGLVVPREMKMTGFAKAFLGVFKFRFVVSTRYSNYQLIE